MICPNCGTKNPDDQLYCHSCGKAIEYQRGHVEQELAQEAEREAQQQMDEEMNNILVFVIALFLLSVTMNLMWNSGHWPEQEVLPSNFYDSPYAVQEYEVEIEDVLSGSDHPRRLEFPPTEDMED